MDIKELHNELKCIEKEMPGYVECVHTKDEPFFACKYAKDVPIRRYIKVGDVDVPRILVTDNVHISLEDINEAIQELAKYNDTLEERFKEEMRKVNKNYFSNIITIFGIFLAIFSLINLALPRDNLPETYSTSEIVFTSLLQSLPLACILIILLIFFGVLLKK